MVIEEDFDRQENVDQFAIDPNEDVPDGELAIGGPARNDLSNDQHAIALGERGAHLGLGLGSEPEPSNFIEGLMSENHLNRATRNGLSATNQLDRALHSIQWQIITRRGQ